MLSEEESLQPEAVYAKNYLLKSWRMGLLATLDIRLSAFPLLLKEAGLFYDAAIDLFQCMGFQGRVGVVQHIVEHLFFTFRLENLLSDSRFQKANILGAVQSLAKQGG